MHTQIASLNNKFITLKEARVSCFDEGFLYGFGLFETMRAYNGKIFLIDRHLRRLAQSAKLINLKLKMPLTQIKLAMGQLLKINSLKDAHIRLTIWQGEDKVNTLIIARAFKTGPTKEYKAGFKAIISAFRQNEQSLLSRIKSLNYLQSRLARQEAQRKKADEAILLNTQGFISEGSRSNIFIVKKNELATPSIDCGCLPGITRQVVFDIAARMSLKIREKRILPKELFSADEAFATNSLIEIMPLTFVNGKPVGRAKPGEITKFILEKYRSLTFV